VAIDADTKLVPSWAVGRRDGFTASAFIRDLADRLASRVQLTTDGHKVYLEAVEGAFGSNIDYAMLVKMYEGDSGKRAVLQLLDRPNLDHPDSRRWESRGDRAGLVHVLGLDDEESTQLLLCLDKGADGSGDLAGADTDRPGRPGPLQSVRGDVVAAPSDLLGVFDRGVDKSLHLLLGHRVQYVLVVVDREHELHRIVLTGEAP